jgi:hypothetical protein
MDFTHSFFPVELKQDSYQTSFPHQYYLEGLWETKVSCSIHHYSEI